MRTFAARRRERIERLRDHASYLADRICEAGISDQQQSFARQRFSAVMWALEEITRLDRIEEILSDQSLTDDQKLIGIEGVCESRYTPTDEDLARAPALARQYVE
jgi:hypothetical protein